MSITNPLQTAFNMANEDIDIEREYAAVPVQQQAVTPTEPPPDIKDEDDKLVEARLDEVYGTAMQAYNNQTAYIEVIDPKFAARNAEVAANFLNIALNAANSRANVKRDRKRANQTFVPYTNKTTQNVIVATREEILRMINVDDQEKKLG